MKRNIALFDIDKTIIKKDSMFLFFLYGIKKRPSTIIVLMPLILYSFLYKLKFITVEKVKAYYFYSIQFLTEEDLRDFFNLIIKKNILNKSLLEMKKKKEQGFYILLVSASPYAYLQFFKEFAFVDDVIGTNLVIENNKYINKIDGKNCKGEEKVNRIIKHLLDQNMEIDFDNSCAYSDSLSDLPMMSLVKNKYLIKLRNSYFKKVDSNNEIEDIIWDS